MGTIVLTIEVLMPEVVEQLTRIADACEILAGTDSGSEGSITKPQIYFNPRSQEMLKMVGAFAFTAVNPDEGVTERKFSLQIDQGTAVNKSYPPETLQSDEVKLPIGSVVHAELIDSDDAGNDSTPAVADFTVTDNIAPAQPGEFGFVATGQVNETTK
jgi:hypothetical protein